MTPLQKLLDYYEHFERLVTKLPKPLQQPLLKEIKPIKDLFLRQRPARLAIAGDPSADVPKLVRALFAAPVESARTGAHWVEYKSEAGARLQVADVRTDPDPDVEPAPDLWLVVRSAGQDGPPVLALPPGDASVIGLLICERGIDEAEPQRGAFHSALRGEPAIREHLAATLSVGTEVRFRSDGTLDEASDRREGIEPLAHVITRELPQEARLEMARLCKVQAVQIEIAQLVAKSVSVICGAIGTQPIPLADFPILTSLQAMMVAAIVYISGRPLSGRLAGEFVAALGANVGAGLVLREGSRAALKFLPGWGNAVSGGIAAAGTYAVGRAAIGYFIERKSMDEARRLFRRRKKDVPRLPPPSPE